MKRAIKLFIENEIEAICREEGITGAEARMAVEKAIVAVAEEINVRNQNPKA